MGAYVVVSGLPGSGKSTLARALARELAVPVLAKDTIKEVLFDSLGSGDVDWSKRLGAASNAVVVALAAHQERAILESFWDPQYARRDLTALDGTVIEVFCACSVATARERYTRRVRHPGHLDEERADDFDVWVASRRDRPLHLGGPLVEVRTDNSAVAPSPAVIAAFVRRQTGWSGAPRAPDGLDPRPDG